MTLNARISRSDGKMELQALGETEQKFLSGQVRANGTFTDQGGLLQLDLVSGRIDITELDLKMSRVSGTGRLTIGATPSLLMEFNAGGARLGQLVFTNVSGSIELGSVAPQIIMEGKLLHQPDIEFSVLIPIFQENIEAEGTLTANDMPSLKKFLTTQPALSLTRDGHSVILTLRNGNEVPIDLQLAEQVDGQN
jgi:hypothetical protein